VQLNAIGRYSRLAMQEIEEADALYANRNIGRLE
jgi:hypothetical protein